MEGWSTTEAPRTEEELLLCILIGCKLESGETCSRSPLAGPLALYAACGMLAGTSGDRRPQEAEPADSQRRREGAGDSTVAAESDADRARRWSAGSASLLCLAAAEEGATALSG